MKFRGEFMDDIKNAEESKYNREIINDFITNKDGITEKLYELFLHTFTTDETFKNKCLEISNIVEKCYGNPPLYHEFSEKINELEKQQNVNGDVGLISKFSLDDRIKYESNIYFCMGLMFIESIVAYNNDPSTVTKIRNNLFIHYFSDIRFNKTLTHFKHIFDSLATDDLVYDIDELDEHTKKTYFLSAYFKNEQKYAFELLNSIDDVSEKNYFRGLLYYKDEDYDKALKYLNHKSIDENSPDINSIRITKLLCYANLGDVESFNNVLREVDQIDYYLTKYLEMLLIINSDKEIKLPKIKTVKSLEYYNDFTNFFMKVIYDVYERLYDYKIAYLSSDGTIGKKDLQEVAGERDILALQKGLISFYPKQATKMIKSILEWDLDVDKLRTKVVKIVTKVVSEHLKIANVLCDYLIFLYRIGEIDTFYKIGITNLDNLMTSDVVVPDNKVSHVLSLLYFESLSNGMENEALANYVEYHQIEKLDVKPQKVAEILSPKGQLAFKEAEWIFNQSQKEDYGWKDAGSISLAYYKIVELEFNDYLSSIFDVTNYQELKDCCHEARMTSDNKTLYKQWDGILDKLHEMEKNRAGASSDLVPHLMLNKINNIMLLLHDEEESFAKHFKEVLVKGLQKRFKDPLEVMKIMEKYTTPEYVRDYRNPPAHAKYLHYDKACECRQVVIDLFYNEIKPIIK